MSIEVKHEEGKWTPHLYFYRDYRPARVYRDIGSGFRFITWARVGKVSPF